MKQPREEVDEGSGLTQLAVQVFRDAIGGEVEIDADSDFFEIGGNSIVAGQVVAILRRELGVKVKLRDLFDSRTAAGLARTLQARIHEVPPAPPGRRSQGR